MISWRRIVAMALAAVMAVSPALACADFCPQSAATSSPGALPPSSPEPMNGGATPEDCADAMNVSSGTGAQSHDPDCQGCSDCPAIASVKSPALASAGALSVDAPTIIKIHVIVSPVADYLRPARYRLTPPANGPPVTATPVILKDMLRL